MIKEGIRPWAWGAAIAGIIVFLVFSWILPVVPLAVAGWALFIIGLVIVAALNWLRFKRE